MDKAQDRHAADWEQPASALPSRFEPLKDGDYTKGGFVRPAPTTYSALPVVTPPADEPLAEDPLSGPDTIVKAVLALGLPFFYIAVTFFFAIEWLNFGHPELQTPVVAAFGGLGGWAAAAVFHYIGATNAVRSLVTGARVGNLPVDSYRRVRMRVS